MEKMIQTIYSEFDSDITITARKGKTFSENEVNWSKFAKVDGINSYSKAIEEIVVVRHEKKWVNASLIGVESNFLDAIQINKRNQKGKRKSKSKKILNLILKTSKINIFNI